VGVKAQKTDMGICFIKIHLRNLCAGQTAVGNYHVQPVNGKTAKSLSLSKMFGGEL